MTIVPATAMPYAAERFSKHPKASTSPAAAGTVGHTAITGPR